MSQVEEIKKKTDIVSLVGDRVALKKAGRNFKGLCPFHSEKTPSFMVNPEMQIYKCFGCKRGGDVYSFLQEYEGMSFLESLEFLAEKAGVKLENYQPTEKDKRKKELLEILHMAGEFYRYILKKHEVGERARKYLKERGLSSEAGKVFGLGYAPDAWRSVSDYLIKKKGYAQEMVERTGLIIVKGKGEYYDRFRGRVMFPLKDHKGKVVGFSGRVLDKSDTAKYINTPETELYSKREMFYGLWENRSWIRKKERVVVVEGELDMIGSWQAGVKEVVAVKGSAFTQEQARLISRYTERVIMALDADVAGEEAVKRSVGVADSHDLAVKVVQIQDGKDPWDVASRSGKLWRKRVDEAVSYYEFLIESVCERERIESEDGLRKATGEIVPVLSEIANLVVQEKYVKFFAKKAGVSEDTVYREIEREKKKAKLEKVRGEVKKIEKDKGSRRERLEEYLLALGLQYFERLGDKLERLEGLEFSQPAVARAVEQVLDWEEERFEIGGLVEELPGELKEMVNRAYLRDLSELEETKIEREFARVVDELREIGLREGMKDLSGKIAKAEKAGKLEKLEGLKKKFSKMSEELSSLG